MAFSMLASHGQNSQSEHAGAFFGTKAVVEIEQGERAVQVEWNFVNLMEEPMVVERIEGLGDSLQVAHIDQIQAGWRECGVIRAILKPGTRSGMFQESIQVYFKGSTKPLNLVLVAKVLGKGEKRDADLRNEAWDPVAAVMKSVAATRLANAGRK